MLAQRQNATGQPAAVAEGYYEEAHRGSTEQQGECSPA